MEANEVKATVSVPVYKAIVYFLGTNNDSGNYQLFSHVFYTTGTGAALLNKRTKSETIRFYSMEIGTPGKPVNFVSLNSEIIVFSVVSSSPMLVDVAIDSIAAEFFN